MKAREQAMRDLSEARAELADLQRENAQRREAIRAELPRAAKSDPPPAIDTPLAWWREYAPAW